MGYCYRKTHKRITAGLAGLIWIGTATTVLAQSATRDLPAFYETNSLLSVSIEIVAPPGTAVVGIEDVPPSGWTNVINISHGGTYDSGNQKVKWPPFFDNLSRTISYDVNPPGASVGTKCFSGIISFDGNELSIAGDDCISPPVMVPAASTLSLIVMVLLLIAAAAWILRRSAEDVFVKK